MQAEELLKNQRDGLHPKQKSREWFIVRRKNISSTDVAAILGEDHFQFPYKILVKKIADVRTPSNRNMEHGNLFEPIARSIYEKIKKVNVHEMGLIKHKIHKFLCASPDGLSSLGILLEIKCPRTRQITLDVLKKYWIQMQMQMEVCDLNSVDFMECSFKYCSYDEYLLKSCEWKGTLSKDNFTINPPSTKKDDTHWWCAKYRIKNIKRDKKWFADNFQELSNFNKVLTKYHKLGILELKKAKLPYKRWDEWVSATQTRNYIMDDPLIDWLKLYRPLKHSHASCNAFSRFIKNRGNEFEQYIIELIQQDFWNDFVQIAEDYQARSTKKFKETRRAMKKGMPIIYKGVLHDDKAKIYGVPDLIVRSDYLSKIFKHAKKYPKTSYHYVIVDIKLKNLSLRVDKKTLLSSPLVNTYKSQLYVYTRMLNKLQNYNTPKAYILGNGWKMTKCRVRYGSNDPFDRPGIVSFNDKEISEKTCEAVTWIRDVRKFGEHWSVDPPSVPELYPNMSNGHDQPWRPIKSKIAEETKDITMLWQCGPKNRKIAHENGVYRWDDDNCISENLGHCGTKTAGTLQAIIDINQGHHKEQLIHETQDDEVKKSSKKIFSDINARSNGLMEPEKIASSMYNFRKSSKNDLFVDFETVPNSISGIGDIIFMIGVGWVTEHKYTNVKRRSAKKIRVKKTSYGEGKWNYKCFVVDKINTTSEKKMIQLFNEFVAKFKKPRMFHWGHFEKSQYKRASEKHCIYFTHNWCDLLSVFKDEPIVVRGAFNFSIKSIGKAMFSHGMISTIWNDDVADGLDAAVQVFQNFCPSVIDNIKKYNEVDVKIMWEILVYLRKFH